MEMRKVRHVQRSFPIRRSPDKMRPMRRCPAREGRVQYLIRQSIFR